MCLNFAHLDRAAWLHALEFQEDFRIPIRIDFVKAQERGTTNEVGDVTGNLRVSEEGHSQGIQLCLAKKGY